ncbi:ABC transporter ATP-binding protein [Haliangium sp.]|uniref:ABC transporter ATP-binding protein n=1 Tax=Haliangium sp. TaxID=2663208 RepID=UPI003D11866A
MMSTSTHPLIRLQHVDKTYAMGAKPFVALSNVDLTIETQELVVVTGKSGSGKSTLLNLVAGLDRVTRGQIEVAGMSLSSLDEDALARFRGQTVGIVFQFFQLLPTLTSAENVMLAMDLVGKIPPRQRRARAEMLLERVGVAEQADKLPAMLSGGQQQRVALARSLANDPALIVADEPTGNLDSHTAEEVMALFTELHAAGKTVLLVTHERHHGLRPTRTLTITDGRLS